MTTINPIENRKQYQRPVIDTTIVEAVTMLCLSGDTEEEEQTERFTVNNAGRLSDMYWD